MAAALHTHGTKLRCAAVWLLVWTFGGSATNCGGIESRTLNGFRLSPAAIPVEEILRGGPPRDGIPALISPRNLPAKRASWLRGRDLVAGMMAAGEARAYPLRILVWHELVNDQLGGRPILVTYCPLCRSVLAFDRRTRAAEVRESSARLFGVSGLLWNSNVLMYDRQSESLWSQGALRAVTGPAAAQKRTLEVLPVELVTWADWRSRHPATTVLSRDTGHSRDYARSPYGAYFASDRLMFPAKRHRQRPGRFAAKEFMLVVLVGARTRAYAIADLRRLRPNGGVVTDRWNGLQVLIHVDATNGTARAGLGGPPRKQPKFATAYMYWFTLSALLPEAELYEPPAGPSS